jgi:hypothetical protein
LSASLSTETLRENVEQCKSKGQVSKRDYAEEKLKKTWDRASLRKETLKNRKEARFSRKTLEVRP